MTEAIGHNSGIKAAKEQLLSVIERVENIERDIKERQDDRKDVYAEAKGNGYDVKALKTLVAIRKIDPGKRHEQEAILDAYREALGMID